MSSKSHPGATNSNWRGGKSSHPLYDVYNEMVGRCHRPTHKRFGDYGDRGITVCDHWRNDFWAFVADMGERPAGVLADGRAAWSLDRVDNDRGYSPENCRWANIQQQVDNRREVYYPIRERQQCAAGHPYTDENTHITKDGKRRCRACARRWAAAARARRAERKGLAS